MIPPDAGAAPEPNAAGVATTGCPTRVVNNAFQVCYFRRLDPTTTDPTRFLGSVQEASLGHPVPDRVYAINHDWGTGPVFDLVAPGNGGSGNDVSGKWRGRLFFPGGNYDMTVWSSGGVRVTVDDNVVLDEWSATDGGRFAVAVSPRRGYHQVVVTWNTAGGRSALLCLHWDRLPDVANPVVSHVRIETFIVDRQDVCIAGDPWTSGTPLRVHNADGSTAEAWQIEDDRGLPVALPPSDPSLASYPQVACYSFGYTNEEKAAIRSDLNGFANLLSSWTFGALVADLDVHEVSGEMSLARIGDTFWLAPWDIAPLAQPYLTKANDFTISFSASHELSTGRYYDIFAAGATFGIDSYSLAGTGYSWISNRWPPLVILHEFEHQLMEAMVHLLGFQPIYTANTGYPACGTGDPDIFKWFPDSEDWGIEPDSPWCGLSAEQAGISEMHTLAHFDPSLRHYPLGRITGNHCRDGQQDFGETTVDQGGDCPPN